MSDGRRYRFLAILWLAIPGAAFLYKDGPPIAHTGGFDEPTCYTCHFDGQLNDPAAWTGIVNLPKSYKADSVYTLTIAVSRSNLGAGGFELSGRFRNGSQAGSFSTFDDRSSVESNAEGVQFVMHTLDGSDPARPDTNLWVLRWTAPVVSDTVCFHLAANAANGDDSELGDLIQTAAYKLAPTPTKF